MDSTRLGSAAFRRFPQMRLIHPKPVSPHHGPLRRRCVAPLKRTVALFHNQIRELLIHPTGLLPDGHFLAAPMRNFLVPQTVHWPVTAGRPFFRATS